MPSSNFQDLVMCFSGFEPGSFRFMCWSLAYIATRSSVYFAELAEPGTYALYTLALPASQLQSISQSPQPLNMQHFWCLLPIYLDLFLGVLTSLQFWYTVIDPCLILRLFYCLLILYLTTYSCMTSACLWLFSGYLFVYYFAWTVAEPGLPCETLPWTLSLSSILDYT